MEIKEWENYKRSLILTITMVGTQCLLETWQRDVIK